MSEFKLTPELLAQVETVYQLRRQESILYRQRNAAELGTTEWDDAARKLDSAAMAVVRGEQALAHMLIKLVKGDVPY